MMRDVERGIENVLAERMNDASTIPSGHPGAGDLEWNPVRRFEDFAIRNMKYLTIGAAGAIVSLSSMLLFWQPSPYDGPVDPVVVGSVLAADHTTARARWIAVAKPVHIMTLESPLLGGLPVRYLASRNDAGEHQDSLNWSGSSADRPDVRVALKRGRSTGLAPSLFIEMTRQQAERGISVARSGQSSPLATKFGPFEVADMQFSDTADSSRACLAFRSSHTNASIHITGWYCAAQGDAVERPDLTCLMDKLILLKSGQDVELRRFFTMAEKERKPCASNRASHGRKPSWLDADGKVPSFRKDVTGSIRVGKDDQKQ